MGGWFRKEIKEPSDFNGLKFRIGGYAGRVLQKLGVVPQQLAGSDIYPALEKGAIDAAEWVGPYDDEKLGFQKVSTILLLPRLVGRRPGDTQLHQRRQAGNALTPAYKSVCARTCSEMANTWMQANHDAANPPALKRLVAGGAKLQPFSPLVMDACLKAALELYNEVAATNPEFKKVWESTWAFRNDQYLWWQVGEYTYDSFLIRNRTRM